MRPVFSRNGGWPKIYPFQYWGDVMASKTKAQLQDGINKVKLNPNNPFMAYVAPIGPHTNIHPYIVESAIDILRFGLPDAEFQAPAMKFSPPIPANRHKNMFPNLKLPERANAPELDRSDKPAWYTFMFIKGSEL
jgi:N-acetylglucosamine-6-sulfatase